MTKLSGSVRKPSRLGRGLNSLISGPVQVMPTEDSPTGAVAAEAIAVGEDQGGSYGFTYLPIDAIEPNPRQPRQIFDAKTLRRLSDSLKTSGVMQPVIVRPRRDGEAYELVAGERRWRAARLAELGQIPAVIRDLSDSQVAEWSLIENLHREDLSPIERAHAFRNLIDQFQLSHEEIGERIGVDRSTITNTLRLLNLDTHVQDLIQKGMLSASQAKVLGGVDDPEQQRVIARRAISQDWSVRRVEQAVKQFGSHLETSDPGTAAPKPVATHLVDLQRQIGQQLGTKVRIRPGRKKGAGMLAIEFYSLDQFDALLERFGIQTD